MSDKFYLVSLDAHSLDISKHHKEGIEAVNQKLKKSRPSISIKVILVFLNFILTLNNFVFNSRNYLKKKGCAMGAKCAPSYGNIFMGWFEETFIFPLLTNLRYFYLRFIDDIFIWNGTKTKFENKTNFLKENNECHPIIKSEYEMFKTKINFLDTTVFKGDKFY